MLTIAILRLLAIKKVTVQKTLAVKLDFTLPAGSHDLKLYFVCDSFVGADQEHEFSVKVGEAEDSDEDDDSDDDEAEAGDAMQE